MNRRRRRQRQPPASASCADPDGSAVIVILIVAVITNVTLLVLLDHQIAALVRTFRVQIDLHATACDVTPACRWQLLAGSPCAAFLPVIGLGLRREVNVVIAIVDVVMLTLLDRNGRLGRLGRLGSVSYTHLTLPTN